jgi:hypothetical protein
MTTVGRWNPNKVRERVLNGTWVSVEELGGMVLLTPTSIAYTGTSASIGTNGSVTFSACSSLSLNGVFSADYDNYMVVCRFTNNTGTSTLNYRMRVGGADNSTASSYVTQELAADATTVLGGRYTANVGYLTPSYATQRAGFVWNVYGPFLAQPTATRTVSASDSSSAYILDSASTHNQSTSDDGFTLNRSANDVSGLISVYGLVGA